MSLKQKSKKIKHFLQLLILIQILIFLYILYQIDIFNKSIASVTIRQNAFAINFSDLDIPGQYVMGNNYQIAASKNGSKYYFASCSGLSRIKKENLIYFKSQESAKNAGYELAKNCQR